jgi:hypothetical protein
MFDTPSHVSFVFGEQKDWTSTKKWLTQDKKMDKSRIHRTALHVLQKRILAAVYV